MPEHGPRPAERPELKFPDTALERLDSFGAAYVPGAVPEPELESVRSELRGLAYHRAVDTAQVRQEAQAAEVVAPYAGTPAIAHLAERITAAGQALGVPETAQWEASEATVMAYEAGSVGITPHLDGRRYRGLIAIVTVEGRGGFAVLPARDAAPSIVWTTEPGDLMLMRGTGWRGQEDGRPFHAAGSPQGGRRVSLSFRQLPASS